MEKHWKLTDEAFVYQFEHCILNPSIFSHEAHLRLAWIYLHKCSKQEAEERIQIGLQKFVSAIGAKDKYNATITLAAMKAVDHFRLKLDTNNFHDFIITFPKLKSNFKALMRAHYSFDIYNSMKAKTTFLQPDLIPFN